MSSVQLSEVSSWLAPLACGCSSPELSKSNLVHLHVAEGSMSEGPRRLQPRHIVPQSSATSATTDHPPCSCS